MRRAEKNPAPCAGAGLFRARRCQLGNGAGMLCRCPRVLGSANTARGNAAISAPAQIKAVATGEVQDLLHREVLGLRAVATKQ